MNNIAQLALVGPLLHFKLIEFVSLLKYNFFDACTIFYKELGGHEMIKM